MAQRDNPGRVQPRAHPADRGFTLIEVLITMAIIALLAAIAVPIYNGILYKSRRNALLTDAKTLFSAFLQYNLDRNEYPPCCTPPEEAFDKTNLWPLTRYEYMGDGSGILQKLQSRMVADYDSPDNPSTNHDFYALLIHGRDNRIQVLVADTDEYPGYEGQNLHGLYLLINGTLEPVDTKKR